MPIRTVLPLILLLAFVFGRFYDLGIRPPHHDEAVNGWFVDGMFRTGFYKYDPQNYHGPIYFYFLALAEMIFGRSVQTLRIVTVFFGGLLTFVPFLYRRWIGPRAAWIAAFVLALSPAVVFYSRYAIHEIPFAFFTALFFYFWLCAREEKFSWKNLIGLGLSLGMLACLKENFIIYLACLLIAEVMTRVYGKEWTFPQKYSLYGLMSLIAFTMVMLVYSALGRDETGISDFFRAFILWSETGSKGNGHEKTFDYWIKIFAQYEWPTLIGVLLTPLALKKKVPQSIRLLSVVSVGTLLAYSIVKYKTPWCLLCFQWGFVLVLAYWCARIWDRQKVLVITALSIMGLHSAYQAYEVSYVNVDAEDSYYIYGQTYRDLMPPIEVIIGRVKNNPSLSGTMRISVISAYTWPLPFLLGEIKQVGYYNESNVPPVIDGDYVFVDQLLEDKFKARLVGNYSRELVRARQWASPMVIYTRVR